MPELYYYSSPSCRWEQITRLAYDNLRNDMFKSPKRCEGVRLVTVEVPKKIVHVVHDGKWHCLYEEGRPIYSTTSHHWMQLFREWADERELDIRW